MKKLALFIVFVLSFLTKTFADTGVDMATELRSSGKIWVVVGVVVTIVLGMYIFLFTINKKVKKLEDK